jgi:uncharacterized protein (DUF924 family)
MTPDEVLDFWQLAGPVRWFARDAAFDGEVARRFGPQVALARRGDCDGWAQTPHGALALILVLDQFPRNIHRNSALAFTGDTRALALAKSFIARGWHYLMPAPLASWSVMPFEHAEDLDAQERAVGLFTTMGLDNRVPWAVVHRDVIRRFGRFPHRNPVLGRKSTPAELAFLAGGGFAG